MEDIKYRKATEKDRENALALLEELQWFHYVNVMDNFKPELDDAGKVFDYIMELREVYVAENEKGELVGLVSFAARDAEETQFTKAYRFVSVNDLIVTQRYRRKGIAHELMGICKKYARDNGNLPVELGVWFENTDAIEFYAHEEFTTKFVQVRFVED